MSSEGGTGEQDRPSQAPKSGVKTERDFSHLKPFQFKPGQSGNPTGRKPGSISLTGRLARKLADKDGARAEKIMERMLRLAESSDPAGLKAIQSILDRIDGPVPKAAVIEVVSDVRKLVYLADDDAEELAAIDAEDQAEEEQE